MWVVFGDMFRDLGAFHIVEQLVLAYRLLLFLPFLFLSYLILFSFLYGPTRLIN